MDIEKRLTNLENLVNSLIKRINNDKFYSDADSAGIRQSVSDVTPYTESKTAYIDDTEVIFENVPEGNLSVFTSNGIAYQTERLNNSVVIRFAPLEEIITVTISVM